MRFRPFVPILLLAAASLAGCNFAMRRTLDEPGRSQTVRVESGQRLYFDLEEPVEGGCRWKATCDDSDVLVKIDRVSDPGRAKVEVRIHRGYDGPSTVVFRYARPGEARPEREWTLALFRRTGDCAFWE